MPPTLHPASPADIPFLAEMLAEAMAWRPSSPKPPSAEVLASRYITAWPRPADGGVVADVGESVGAAWYRLFTADDHGYGFIDESTPEVSIGVKVDWRGRGVGRLLIEGLVAMARDQGYQALSLSVEEENEVALGLYERVGFERVRRVGQAWTMRLLLSKRDPT